MKKILCALAAMAAMGCAHPSVYSPTIAEVSGDKHVVVRAEAGRLWWAHRAWTEPHPLCDLPASGHVDNLVVRQNGAGFAVSFDQGGQTWEGTFGGPDTTMLARSGR